MRRVRSVKSRETYRRARARAPSCSHARSTCSRTRRFPRPCNATRSHAALIQQFPPVARGVFHPFKSRGTLRPRLPSPSLYMKTVSRMSRAAQLDALGTRLPRAVKTLAVAHEYHGCVTEASPFANSVFCVRARVRARARASAREHAHSAQGLHSGGGGHNSASKRKMRRREYSSSARAMIDRSRSRWPTPCA